MGVVEFDSVRNLFVPTFRNGNEMSLTKVAQDTEIVIYQTDDNDVHLQIKLKDETVWLTQEQLAQLFGKGRSTIAEHIGNIFTEGELVATEVCREFRQTYEHGSRKGKTQTKSVKHYNLDLIISEGTRPFCLEHRTP